MRERKKIIYVQEPPEGLFYMPKLISPDEELALLQQVEAQPFEPYDHHGYKANREVVYFGLQGGYNGVGAEEKTSGMPDWLLPVRERFANLLSLDPGELEMSLVARYKPGAGIGWHRDRPQFGPTVFGLSLASDAEMRFRRFLDDKEEMFKIKLEHGAGYLISGEARSVWQHGMNPVNVLRYSITFRTIKAKDKQPDPRHASQHIATRLAELNLLPSSAQSTAAEPKQLKLPYVS